MPNLVNRMAPDGTCMAGGIRKPFPPDACRLGWRPAEHVFRERLGTATRLSLTQGNQLKMKRMVLAATFLMPIAAYAGDYNGGHNENGNGCRNHCGDTTAPASTQINTINQPQSNASAVSKSVANADAAARAYGGRGGNATATVAPGAVSPTLAPSSRATAPTNVTGGSYTGSYSGEYYGGSISNVTTNNSRVDARSAPTVVVPSIGSGGQCGVVGFGAGGSGLGGGGGFGPSWESTNCRNYYIAQELAALGHREAATILLGKITPEAKEALEAEAQAHTAPVAIASAAPLFARPAWCDKVKPDVRARNVSCQ